MIRNILFILLYSCSTSQAPDDCKTRMGYLLLNKMALQWGETQQKKEYTNDIKLYNPTNKDIFIKIHDNIPGFKIVNPNQNSIDCVKQGFTLASKTSETIRVFFTPSDSLELGSFKRGLHFELDGALHLAPFEMFATILEYFDTPSQKQLALPIIEVEKDSFDFGSIPHKEKITASFPIKNIGKENLIIRKIEATCSCTKFTVLKQIIPPGDSTILDVEFSTKGKIGFQCKQVKLFCNDPHRPLIHFIIKGHVEN